PAAHLLQRRFTVFRCRRHHLALLGHRLFSSGRMCPSYPCRILEFQEHRFLAAQVVNQRVGAHDQKRRRRSEEHTSELQSPDHLVSHSSPTRRSSDLQLRTSSNGVSLFSGAAVTILRCSGIDCSPLEECVLHIPAASWNSRSIASSPRRLSTNV